MNTVIIPLTTESLDAYINRSYKDANSNFGTIVFQDELTMTCIFDENQLPVSAEFPLEEIDFVADSYPLLLPELLQVGGVMYPLNYLLSK